VSTRGLATPDGGTDQPEQGEDHRSDPEDVEGKTSPGENKHDEEQQQQDHASILPAGSGLKTQSAKCPGGERITERPSGPIWVASGE
jgi:hypothetical protein